MKVFDNYEISPCHRLDDAGLPDPDGQIFEVCEPDEADVWTLYGHIPSEGAQAIGDFTTREDAEEVFERIVGVPFGTTPDVTTHLRVMHAGPKLLAALEFALEFLEANDDDEDDVVTRIAAARAAIAEATGRAA